MFLATAILSIIESVAREPSTKKKQELLMNAQLGGREREVFRRILHAAYSPRLNYGVKYIEPKEAYSPADALHLDGKEFWDLLNALSERKASGNAAKDAIDQFMSFAEASTAELFRRIVHKDMRAGINASTINKVFPKLIEETPYMRCSLPKDVDFNTWPWDRGVYVQLKSDGTFQTVTKVGDTFTIVSRSGEVMPNEAVPQIIRTLSQFQDDNTRLEGEFIVIDPTGGICPRAEGNGMINSLRQGGSLPPGHYVKYIVWDYVDARGGGFLDEREYATRFARLVADFVNDKDCEYVDVTPNDIVHDKKAAVDIYKHYLSMGLEGAILKRPDAIYKDGTSREQVKLKVEKTVDVKVTGFIEGAKGKKTEKTFGSMTFESADGIVRGSTSGFKDDLRALINENREEWVGAIIAVKANALTQNRKDVGFWALSHPRFDERRFDKNEADTFERIKAIFDDIEI